MFSKKEMKVDTLSGFYQIAEDYLIYNEYLKSDFFNNISPDRVLNKNFNPFTEQLNKSSKSLKG